MGGDGKKWERSNRHEYNRKFLIERKQIRIVKVFKVKNKMNLNNSAQRD